MLILAHQRKSLKPESVNFKLKNLYLIFGTVVGTITNKFVYHLGRFRNSGANYTVCNLYLILLQ
jgi:hypothetical protein